MKVPDGGCVDERARTHSHTDIGRANRHEHEGRQTGVRMPVAGELKARSDRLSSVDGHAVRRAVAVAGELKARSDRLSSVEITACARLQNLPIPSLLRRTADFFLAFHFIPCYTKKR